MRRIVLDTNCLLMCVSSKSPYHKVWTEFVEGKVAWCVSTEILSEYMEILGNAEYIVSDDSHFRVLNDIDWPKLQLVTIQEYVKKIDSNV